MAAKAPVSKKTAKAKVTPKATVQTAAAKGLQLSAQQRKAYRTAYSAAATLVRQKRALQAGANRFQRYRLNSAYATMKRAQAQTGLVHAAASAAYATKLTWLQSRAGQQNKALQSRIELDMYTHANVLGRLQYAQAGEKTYVNKAVMRTVDNAQASAYERQLWNKIAKTAKKASKSSYKNVKTTAASRATTKAAAAAGKAAGLKAASAPGLVKAAKAAAKASHARSSKSKKAPAAKAKARTAPSPWQALVGRTMTPAVPKTWLGNDTDPHCIAFAIANHLQQARSFTADAGAIAELVEAAGPDASIEETLWQVWLLGWPKGTTVHLGDYRPVEAEDMAAELSVTPLVVGYDIPQEGRLVGHAALSLPTGKVVTWGHLEDRPEVEEAWQLRWDALGSSSRSSWASPCSRT